MGLFSVALPVEPQRHKSPAAALLLSLLLPGAGHLYCGKRSTGIWTAVLFLIPMLAVLYVQPALVPNALIFAVPIYIFAFLDAFLTTREANAGVDWPPNGNPRIAATLNLLTSGLGYFYLGERTLGLAVSVGGRFAGAWLPVYLAILLQLGFAAHAYVRCIALYPPEAPSIAPVTSGSTQGL